MLEIPDKKVVEDTHNKETQFFGGTTKSSATIGMSVKGVAWSEDKLRTAAGHAI